MDARIKAVTFNEEVHKYFYNGKELHGVTGAISKLMEKSFPDTDTVKLATIYGSDVHKEVENYFNNNHTSLSTEGASFVVQSLKDFSERTGDTEDIKCEVMVSDFETTASKIDVVLITKDNNAYLFDVKTTSHFDRTYCSLQLSVYKYLYEKCYGINVKDLFVIGTKSKRLFRILYQGDEKVKKILDMNREKTI